MSDEDFLERTCEAHYWHEHAQRDQIVARNNFVATSIALLAALAYGLHALDAPDLGPLATGIVFFFIQLFVLGAAGLMGFAVWHLARSAAPIKDDRHYEYVTDLRQFTAWMAELEASNPEMLGEAHRFAMQGLLDQMNAASAQNQEANKQRLIDSVTATRHAAHASLSLVFGGGVYVVTTIVAKAYAQLL